VERRLLDYLAVYLVENGWDLKKTLAHIATSQAYQSQAQVVAKDTDDHGYVYAGPRAKRLTAEQFVDAVWQLTGAAPTKMDASVLRGKVDPELAKEIRVPRASGSGATIRNPPPARPSRCAKPSSSTPILPVPAPWSPATTASRSS
jgi:hypothetical protein